MKHKHYIDAHKGVTSLVVLALIAAYGEWDNVVAWVYLALHGTYGVLWILKSRLFGDTSWERPVSVWYGLATWFLLSLYWVTPWLIVSGNANHVEPWFIALCISLYTTGVFLHFVSDMQKHLSLQLRPGVLITDGLWGVVRAALGAAAGARRQPGRRLGPEHAPQGPVAVALPRVRRLRGAD